MTIDMERFWKHHEYVMFNGRDPVDSDTSTRIEAKRCFFHGVFAGLHMLLRNKSYMIKDVDERLAAEESFDKWITSIHDQVIEYILHTRFDSL